MYITILLGSKVGLIDKTNIPIAQIKKIIKKYPTAATVKEERIWLVFFVIKIL
jgi:hypothetical protein